MVNHYTANKRLRSTDAYTPGAEKAGFRPDYAVAVYSKILKSIYPDTPVIIGGIEASLRRVTHYDYWSDKLMPSILETIGADLLVYGMGGTTSKRNTQTSEKKGAFHSLWLSKRHTSGDQSKGIPKNKNWQDITIRSHQDCLEDKKLCGKF